MTKEWLGGTTIFAEMSALAAGPDHAKRLARLRKSQIPCSV
ncbi:hypothetical protein ACIOHE_13490 [Streptomyces sp. NPDC087851]